LLLGKGMEWNGLGGGWFVGSFGMDRGGLLDLSFESEG